MFKFYEVGGKVRDELLGIPSKDIDFVAVPEARVLTIDKIFKHLTSYLKLLGYEIFLVTPEMFTIRAKFPKDHKNAGIVADFVLARKELSYIEGTRTPIVVPGTLYDDLARRDFTVNAIAKDEDGNYIDPFDGIRDLKIKLLRTPINGDITFEDDPLRLLRAIRFKVTKEFMFHTSIIFSLMKFDYVNKFHVVSEERIREELYKCFKHNTSHTLSLLTKYHNLSKYIFNKTNLWLKPTNEK